MRSELLLRARTTTANVAPTNGTRAGGRLAFRCGVDEVVIAASGAGAFTRPVRIGSALRVWRQRDVAAIPAPTLLVAPGAVARVGVVLRRRVESAEDALTTRTASARSNA